MFSKVAIPLALFLCSSATHLSAQVIISEIMAGNTRTVADEDREFPDWIELYNSGTNVVNLLGWSLTDDPSDPDKWQFPGIALPPNDSLIVFASDKNRRLTNAPLHTNFRLAIGGDYLALASPDGKVVEAFAPKFPPQLEDVSYGFPMQERIVRLVSPGASGRLWIPSHGAYETLWTELEWPDDDWQPARTGIGFDDGSAGAVAVVIADSMSDFSGSQGHRQWHYGYYDRTADRVTGYQAGDFIPFPNREGPFSAVQFWNGAGWDWFGGDPPWTEIGRSQARPNGVNSGGEHWAIRRWISSVQGTVTIEWKLAKQQSGGSGVLGRILHQGISRDQATLRGDDVTGVTRRLTVANVQIGDALDFALAPTGISSAADDLFDAAHLTALLSVTNGYKPLVETDVRPLMQNVNATAFVRIPFQADGVATFEFLTLRMKYDDGFIAWLNGVEVARRNAPEAPAWNASATERRRPEDAVRVEEIDLSQRLGLIREGLNMLAIQALNISASDGTLLIVPELEASSVTLDLANRRYFAQPSPGAVNGAGSTRLGPVLTDIQHEPQVPAEDEPLNVTARAAASFSPVKDLTLIYRVHYSAETRAPMFDDGLHGDGAAGDRVYGAVIPAGASARGQMIRYAISAVDESGVTSRWPPYPDPRNSPQYFGTMVADPTIASALPVLHWFIENPRAADSETGTRSSVFFRDQLYDNVGVNLHGQSSSSFPKKSYDFDFHRGFHFRYSPDESPVEDFNLLTTYPDKSHLRNLLAYETYRDAGAAHHIAFPIRVHQNGAFFSHAHFVEDGDEDYLRRLGYDPDGALYKMYNVLDSSTSGAEKKTRKYETNGDLQALIAGVRRTGTARAQFLYDNINIPAMVNYLAAMIITGGVDCCHKNYYAYRDTNGSGEWWYLPWDVDLTFGRNWNSANTYFDDTMFPANPLFVGGNNTLISALFGTPAVRQMYLRRVRTLMDDLLQHTNVPPAELKYERRIDEIVRLIAPDAALDFAKWTTWGQRQTLTQAVAILKNQYLPARRAYLNRQSDIPRSQPADLKLVIRGIEFNPASGNQSEEFLQLGNTNSFAVDVSGWQIAGAVSHTFHSGTVIPANGSLYVSPNVRAFRARKTAPSGAQSLFVQGNYQGQLSARGETVTILDRQLRPSATLTYPAAPTPAQEYLRVTEIMSHPIPIGADGGFQTADFEFLALKNIGPTPLDLAGVRISDGVEFVFPVGSLPLPEGGTVFVARNPLAFVWRYGAGFHIAGPYGGSLDNSGETLRLNDRSGEKILEFKYDGEWQPAANGAGFSLVAADERAAWDLFGERNQWRASPTIHGSPAQGPPGYAAWSATHFNTVELQNPLISGPAADADGDGRPNRDEFISGTDPRDASSYLWIEALRIERAGSSSALLRFSAVPGRAYTVEYLDRVGGAWQMLREFPSEAQTGTIEFEEPIGAATRFYRLSTFGR